MNYYSEWDPYAAQWIRNLIDAGLIPPGHVDTRSITDVQPSDLAGYRQCHFFAGIAGWSLAARLAGWPDDRELWTGSAPCQPFSVAGKGKAQDDDRHLWPHFLRLIRARRPAVVMGEQVAAAVGKNWLDGVSADLEAEDYACRAVVVPACAVDAPHRRDRLWFVAHTDNTGLEGQPGHVVRAAQGWREPSRSCPEAGVLDRSEHPSCTVENAKRPCGGCEVERGEARRPEAIRPPSWAGGPGGGIVANALRQGSHASALPGVRRGEEGARAWNGSAAGLRAARSHWDGAGWLIGHDGKARRFEPSIRLLAHGVPARVGKLRAGGNAIVPEVAAEVIGAYMDCYPEIV
ncbi:DNA cytosine methyltransferase [Stenotrophomonas maltophilia]|uniref:DNA cytosine methyltransferase n=1 Tax=Stenotrophomonas maltophilia TaxID=40324 RepID=UPI0031C1A899|nr:DNA cytosine methyltransferase [Stenotrophomonas maltophilia]MCF3553329.1 DNA cytosine methyltransferase [Stenotrophomonas maltophilia]